MDIRMSNIASPMPQIRAKFTNKLGIPLSGCKVYTYEPNSNIPKKTWIDIDKTVENTNPILLDSAGEADIFLDGLYRMVVKDRFGFVVYDVEKTGTHTEWDASFVTYNGQTQKKINDGLESIAAMLLIENPRDGMRVYVKSYIAGAGKGAGTYVYDAAKSGINDGVLCLNGWCLASTPDIFSGGVLADGSDDTVALQRTYDALHSLGMDIDLLGNAIKTISLDIDSNTVIKNGTLDVYDWNGSVDFPDTYPESNWRRTPIMLKNTPRNLIVDFEYSFKYPDVPLAENITFRNLKFKAKRRLFTAYKVNNLLFDGCEFTWDSSEIINIIGGYHSTTFVNDTDTKTHILTPVNGYCEDIVISGNKFTCLTPTLFSSATHVVASRSVTVRDNKYYNVPLGSRLDIWNTKVNVFGNEYLFDDAAVLNYLDTGPEAIDSDYIGVYIGQNTSEVTIHNNVFDGVYRPIYVEVGSHVDICGNNFKNRIGQRWWSYGIVLQGNLRDFSNIYWGNASFITVRENKFSGFGSAVVTSTALPAGRKYGHAGIVVKDNIILGHSPQPAVVLNKTLNLVFSDNKVDGWVAIGSTGGVQDVSDNTINHQSADSSTYPLIISNTNGALIDATNNTLISNIGECIQLVNTTPSACNLTGSMLVPSANTNFLNVSNTGQLYGSISTGYRTSFTRSVDVNLGNGAIGTYSVSIPNIRVNDFVSVHLQSANDLWTASGIALDFEYEPVGGAVKLRIKNISGKPVSFSPVFFIHFQVNVTPL